MDFFTKIIFHFKKVKIIIITGRGKSYTSESVWQVLAPRFKVKKLIEKMPHILDVLTNEIFIIETDLKNQNIFKKLVNLTKVSQLPILVVTNIGDIPVQSESFAGSEKETIEIRELAQLIPAYGFLILNFDDKTVRKIDNVTNLKSFTFGFQEGADFRVSDVHTNTGTNFKINYKGKIIPVWQEKLSGKEHIYSGLAASCVGIVLGLNFVEISETLKNCRPCFDKIRL